MLENLRSAFDKAQNVNELVFLLCGVQVNINTIEEIEAISQVYSLPLAPLVKKHILDTIGSMPSGIELFVTNTCACLTSKQAKAKRKGFRPV
jgi:hypothetical protein